MKSDFCYEMTVYFTSGKKIKIVYYKEEYEKLLNALKKGWITTFSIGEEVGFCFHNATHYVTRKIT